VKGYAIKTVDHCIYVSPKQCASEINMVEEVRVVLRRSESCGLGFSLLGTAGLPPIIYDIIENSPAAESGEVTF
jgi:hypothetical protein